jgi:ABC-type sugar transport system ATPase subunit
MRVRFEHVTKSYGAERAVNDVTLDVAAGECLVLLGPSGCGKTTLLRLLAGLERVDSGAIFIGDRAVQDVAPADRDVAMVFQNYALYPHFSVFDNIAFPLRTRRIPDAEVRSRVAATAARLGLDTMLDRKPAQLSGGQQQRVALARAIVRGPSVYLMDEPLSNLDAQLRLHTRTELKRLQADLGTTTIYVTHDQGEAMTLGRRVAVMSNGSIVQIGPPLDLYRRPANRFVARFLGSPPINLVPADRVDGLVPPAAAHGAAAGTEVGIRPEDVRLSTQPRPGAVEARVLVVEPMGNETLVTIERGGVSLVARAAADVQTEAGATVWIDVSPDRALWFDARTGERI